MTGHLLRQAEFKFQPTEADAVVGAFQGYGAVFGNKDAYGDVIAPGAFTSSLKAWQAQKRFPPMLLQHAGGGMSGSASDLVPIGVWDEMTEDGDGLLVKGRLIALDTDRGKSVYAAMRAGALDGLSIGFIPRAVEFGKKADDPARTLKAIDLVEVSVVTFPANGLARVEAVKSASQMTEREFERFLREAGFTREEAKTIVAKGYRTTRRDAMPSEESLSSVLAALKTLSSALTGDTQHGTDRSQAGDRDRPPRVRGVQGDE